MYHVSHIYPGPMNLTTERKRVPLYPPENHVAQFNHAPEPSREMRLYHHTQFSAFDINLHRVYVRPDDSNPIITPKILSQHHDTTRITLDAYHILGTMIQIEKCGLPTTRTNIQNS